MNEYEHLDLENAATERYERAVNDCTAAIDDVVGRLMARQQKQEGYAYHHTGSMITFAKRLAGAMTEFTTGTTQSYEEAVREIMGA